MSVSNKYILFFCLCLTIFVYGNKVNILYTANVNATFTNCNCGSNPLGGIDRVKTYFDSYKEQNHNVLVIDGGNFFNSYSFLELNKKILQSLSLLNYDLLAPGMYELIEQKDLFDNYKQKYQNKLISTNTDLSLNKYKDFTVNKCNIRFYNYLSEALFKYTDKPQWLNIDSNIKSFDYLKNGINVLIYNGYLPGAKKFLSKHDQFDIVLLSTDQQEGTWKIGNSTIIGGSHDAEKVVLIQIDRNKTNKDLSVTVEYIEMDSTIDSDENILKLFKHFIKE